MEKNSIACIEHFLQCDVLLVLLFILYFKYGNSTICASEPFEQEHSLNNFLIRVFQKHKMCAIFVMMLAFLRSCQFHYYVKTNAIQMVCNIITVIIPFVINIDNKENTSVFFAMDPDEIKNYLNLSVEEKCTYHPKMSGIFDHLLQNEKIPTSIQLFSINTKPIPILFIVFFDSVPEHRQLFQL